MACAAPKTLLVNVHHLLMYVGTAPLNAWHDMQFLLFAFLYCVKDKTLKFNRHSLVVKNYRTVSTNTVYVATTYLIDTTGNSL